MPGDWRVVAEYIAVLSGRYSFFLLRGPMGSGKTTLMKYIAAALGCGDMITSPTFSIINEYICDNQTVYHFDLYRIGSDSELWDTGFEDYLDAGKLLFLEWPEIAEKYLPSDQTVNIAIQAKGQEGARNVVVKSPVLIWPVCLSTRPIFS